MEPPSNRWSYLLHQYIFKEITPDELGELEQRKGVSVLLQAQFEAFTDKNKFRERLRIHYHIDVAAGLADLQQRYPYLFEHNKKGWKK